jgi:UDP-glucose 4-epimerase
MGKILLTGGCGFIGSHTAVELINEGYEIVIADDLSNSSRDTVDKIETITGKRPLFYEIDVADAAALTALFAEQPIDAVIHFAGFKAVGESVEKPLAYYRNNLDSTLTLLETMSRYGTKCFVFSSSATVYGDAEPPFSEELKTGGCTNPYGWTKYMIEQILKDAAHADPSLSVVLLRYFNPVGAHESGLIGEKPSGIPNNLMPYISQVAAGIRDHLNVFGNDYPTPDGTCIRDYIHVVDLAKGHVAALGYGLAHTGAEIFNLGTGRGSSVLEMIRAFETANHLTIPFEIAPRRAGDLPFSFAKTEKAEKLLGWKAQKSLTDMCRDAWTFEKSCH